MTSQQQPQAESAQVEAVRDLHARYDQIRSQLGKIIVGMEDVIEETHIAMLCRGHCILEGVPGLAKTLLISTLSSMLGLTFRRIQFTPDLMPSDISGTDILEEDQTTGRKVFRFVPGPLFGNVILADEINRTPPKTQSALLEAMQERQVTVGGKTYPLPAPFFVLATQNPIEQEGTYPLPEAQLDRFMMKVKVAYPSKSDEIEIAKRVTTSYEYQASVVLPGEVIEQMQKLVRTVPVGDHVYDFAASLARATRPEEAAKDDFVRRMVLWGAGPRATIYLLLAAKARAVLRGRFHATVDDVLAMAHPVLRHRIVPTFNAEAEGVSTDHIVDHLLKHASATGIGRLEPLARRAAE